MVIFETIVTVDVVSDCTIMIDFILILATDRGQTFTIKGHHFDLNKYLPLEASQM